MPADGVTGPWIILIPLVAVVSIVLRNSRTRRLKVEQLWIAPAIILALTATSLAVQPPPPGQLVALEVLALALGAGAGWWRGRLTRIAVDPETHALTSKTSPLGMLLILGLFAVRYGLRSLGGGSASRLPISAPQLTDVLMLLAVGLVCAQRLEMALRATRLLREAQIS